jgi:hypothetical protein
VCRDDQASHLLYCAESLRVTLLQFLQGCCSVLVSGQFCPLLFQHSTDLQDAFELG